MRKDSQRIDAIKSRCRSIKDTNAMKVRYPLSNHFWQGRSPMVRTIKTYDPPSRKALFNLKKEKNRNLVSKDFVSA